MKVESIGSATNPNNFNITKCGLIAAYNAGTIRRCSVMVNYTLYVAGEIGVIAYQNSGIIENCLSAVGTGTGSPKFPGRMVNSEQMGSQAIPIQRKTMPLQKAVKSQTATITTPNQESAMQHTRVNYTRTETNPQ